MVHYKLVYFPLRARGEIVRQIFAYAGEHYEERVLTFPDWPSSGLKELAPFGQLPILEVDGKPLGQSYAIARYLAKQFGLAGRDSLEEAEVDALADQFKDYLNDVIKYFGVMHGFAPGDVAALRAELFVPNFKKHFALFEKVLAASTSGFFVGDGLTWVDLLVSQHVQDVLEKDLAVLEEFKHVLAHRKKVQGLERIKHWIATRPDYVF